MDRYHGIESMTERSLDEVVAMLAPEAMREEGNCEDSVNRIAYDGFVVVRYGEARLDELSGEFEGFPKTVGELMLTDELMGMACDYVAAHCEEYGFEWEEYRR